MENFPSLPIPGRILRFPGVFLPKQPFLELAPPVMTAKYYNSPLDGMLGH